MDYEMAPSDFMAGWVMASKAGDRTQHFRTQEEPERYVASHAYRNRSIAGKIGCGMRIGKPSSTPALFGNSNEIS